MKRIILTTIAAALCFVLTYAQQANRGGGIRQQLAELDAITDDKVLDGRWKTERFVSLNE